jgi:hypothetical protein
MSKIALETEDLLQAESFREVDKNNDAERSLTV